MPGDSTESVMNDNGAHNNRPCVKIGTEEINVKGRMTSFTSVEIDGLKIVTRGKYIRIVELREEWDQDVSDPEAIAWALKTCGIRFDLFTFIQRLPQSRPRYGYHMEWDSIAAIPISNYENWLKYQIPDQTRNKIKKAKKAGVEIREISFDDQLVQGISDIYNESPVRQGTKNTQYNMELSLVKKLNSTFLERADFIGAYFKDELIGYLKIVYTDKFARVMGILAKIKDLEKSPMNLLIAKGVEICAAKGAPYFVYAKYDYGKNVGSDTLKDFKKNNGFENILLPRYYIPLNGYGKLMLALGFYKGLKNILPRWLVRALLQLRERITLLVYTKGADK